MKYFFAGLLLCFCLTTQSNAANRYKNDIRSMPFIEMMVAMMSAMNRMMGIDNKHYYPGLGTLPYSPAMLPALGSGLGGFNNLPMSPADLPMNNMMNNSSGNSFQDNFPIGQNASNSASQITDFWNPNGNKTKTTVNKTAAADNTKSMNGIWQSLSGEVIAIYNNSHFIWSDGKTRNLAGRLLIRGNNMIAYFSTTQKKLYFQFYKEPGQFIVRDQNSRIYTFKRLH